MTSIVATALMRPRPRAAALHRAGGRLFSEWTRQRETLSHLRDAHADREVYLVGTAHVSQRSADEVGGWHNAHLMRVALAVTWDSAAGDFRSWNETEVPALIEYLRSIQRD